MLGESVQLLQGKRLAVPRSQEPRSVGDFVQGVGLSQRNPKAGRRCVLSLPAARIAGFGRQRFGQSCENRGTPQPRDRSSVVSTCCRRRYGLSHLSKTIIESSTILSQSMFFCRSKTAVVRQPNISARRLASW